MSIQVHFNDVNLSVISIPRSKLWIFANSVVQLLYNSIGDEKKHRDSFTSSENGSESDADDSDDEGTDINDIGSQFGKLSTDFESSTRKSVDNSSKPQSRPTPTNGYLNNDKEEPENDFFHVALTPTECTIICSADLSNRLFDQPLKMCQELGYSDVEILPQQYLSLIVDSDGGFAKSRRILELTKPLSENNVALFYISSHFNDIVLIPSNLKKRVEKILILEHFIFSESSDSYISTYDIGEKEEPVLSELYKKTFELLAREDIHPQIHEKHKLLLTGARPGEIKYCILKTIKLISLATTSQPSYFAITRTFSNELSLILPKSHKLRSKYGYKSTSTIGSTQDVLVPIAMDLSKLPLNCTGIVAGLANELIIRGGNVLEIGYLSMAKSGIILIPDEDLDLARNTLSEF